MTLLTFTKHMLHCTSKEGYMLARIVPLGVALVLGIAVVFGGNKRPVEVTMDKVDVEGVTVSARTGAINQPEVTTNALTWVAVDTMPNAFGTASRGVKPIAYDPVSNAMAHIYRGNLTYGTSSGQLWYSISHDGAATWRRVGPVNTGVALRARYPSCAIYNPTASTDTNDVFFVFAAPQLLESGADFGYMVWGVDAPIGANGGVGFESNGGDGNLWSNAQIWTATGSDELNWAMYRRSTAVPHDDLWRWHTQDFVAVTAGQPATWNVSSFSGGTSTFGLEIGGTERNGVHYFGKWGPFAGDPNINTYDNLGYSTSTDGGISWSAWTRPQPDWRSVPGVGGQYDFWFYGGAGAYSKEMLVDANGYVHFFAVTLDTLTTERQIVEVYESASGWQSHWVTTDLKESVDLIYPGAAGALNQMGNHLNGAVSADGTVLALVWLDANTQGEAQTDIWFSCRRITDAGWSTPVNLTQTPDFRELLLHAAPVLKSNGGNSYTIFLGRSYESGVTTFPPESGNPTVVYASSYTFDVTSTGVGDDGVLPQKFALSQNYPNPFNPTTRISYTIPGGTNVKLTVFNSLGQEVATLVDGFKEAGVHEASFSAAGIPSGMYFYRINAGGFTETRKMVVLK